MGGDCRSGWHRKKVSKNDEKTTNNLVVPSRLFALDIE
jgi:hypothetical protein